MNRNLADRMDEIDNEENAPIFHQNEVQIVSRPARIEINAFRTDIRHNLYIRALQNAS